MEKDVRIDFAKMGGLIPAIAQDADSGQVLMLAFMNQEAWRLTLATGEAHYFSRSSNAIWHKGATSGHTQKVKDIAFDCDKDVLLIQVEQTGAACHEGYKSCFFRSIARDGGLTVTESRLVDPDKVCGKQ